MRLESTPGFREQAVGKRHICINNGRGKMNTQVVMSRGVSQFLPSQSIIWAIKTERKRLKRTTIRDSENRNEQYTRQNSAREEGISEI
jgi:hypothetical protein